MNLKSKLPAWFVPEEVKPAIAIGVLLCGSNYVLDLLLYWWHIPGAATVVNDLAIGILGALVSMFYMFSVRTNQIYLRAKERMNLTAELNHHIRNALTIIRYSASLENPTERVRRIDEVIERIDRVLIDLVPTAGSTDAPRYFFSDQQ